jgi:hypothetical protein
VAGGFEGTSGNLFDSLTGSAAILPFLATRPPGGVEPGLLVALGGGRVLSEAIMLLGGGEH